MAANQEDLNSFKSEFVKKLKSGLKPDFRLKSDFNPNFNFLRNPKIVLNLNPDLIHLGLDY
jgi:hypothetical protein